MNFSFILVSYETTMVEGSVIKPVETKMQFKTDRKVGRVGVMLVGLGEYHYTRSKSFCFFLNFVYFSAS